MQPDTTYPPVTADEAEAIQQMVLAQEQLAEAEESGDAEQVAQAEADHAIRTAEYLQHVRRWQGSFRRTIPTRPPARSVPRTTTTARPRERRSTRRVRAAARAAPDDPSERSDRTREHLAALALRLAYEQLLGCRRNGGRP
jgi:hypothetical protein